MARVQLNIVFYFEIDFYAYTNIYYWDYCNVVYTSGNQSSRIIKLLSHISLLLTYKLVSPRKLSLFPSYQNNKTSKYKTKNLQNTQKFSMIK